jgi:predicted permease
MLAAITPLMMALDRAGRSDPAALAADIARRVALNPLLIATVLAFAAAALGVGVPAALDGLFTLLRHAAIPLGLLLLGATLPFPVTVAREPEVPGLLVVKLIGHPLIVFLLLGWIGGFDRIWIGTAVVLAALPPTAGVLAVAKDHGIAPERIAATVVVATAASMVTLAITLGLVAGGGIPPALFR